ncbi:capsular biosynthesis protein [Enterococcus sp. JM4C]|uniref:polysaccharide pyruvyl transferase family protein n=1 Tax=Candidatus Enterococcus huntleyi TaxID=1857217 RepID=UPI00137ACACD|nr:polysaccharide pyruvyl transferase family protein [Enterococcus sp. JM4C]KAF1298820.1 capsular biosynthesis protein [Enterococcus sp. JM4C]
MKNIVIFDTSIASLNMGDEIIVRSTKRNMKDLFSKNYCMTFPTHTPTYYKFQNLYAKEYIETYSKADLKFVCGSNLLFKNMLRPMPVWNINLFNTKVANASILLGVGSGENGKKINFYTKSLYKKLLNKNYIHSVRDEKTKIMVESLGYRAINTGCPTLWSLDEEHCKKIPTKKSDSVIFTLTHYEYAKNVEKDSLMIDILKRNYNNVYFWPQCVADYDYLVELGQEKGVTVVTPNLDSYESILQNDMDYVGSRLHGGIFAIQNYKRAIILAIDNRAREIKKTNHIPCIERDELDVKLEDMIKSDFATEIYLDKDKINTWKNQFIESTMAYE